jgi:lycopene cyclase domain-containing protein
MEYISILFVFLACAVFLDIYYKVHLYHSLRERIFITLLFFIIGVAWDSFAVYRHHWAFPGDGLTGIYFGNLPLEEYLFSLVVPFWVITIYKLLDRKIK